MVRWRGSKPSPLHSTVPLDGSQTVPGLRELERSARGAAVKRSPGPQPSKGRPPRKRAAGRSLDSLTVDDAKAPPRPWRIFTRGGAAGAWSAAYDVPADLEDLQERLEANVVHYLPNYLRVWAGLFVLVIYVRPAAMVGVAIALGVTYLDLGLSSGSYNLDPEAAQLARGLGLVACWIAVAWSRCLKALLRWVLMSATFTLVHGSLRADEASRARTRGVPLAAVLNLSNTREHDDPRRVFRELWHVVRGYGLFAVLTAVDFCSYQYVAASHWLRVRLERGVRLRPASQFLY